MLDAAVSSSRIGRGDEHLEGAVSKLDDPRIGRAMPHQRPARPERRQVVAAPLQGVRQGEPALDTGCSGGPELREPGRSWTAFLKIPFAGLAVSPKPGDTWRINFFRIERRPKKEFSSWSPLSTDAPEFHSPNRFGVLEFTESK